MTPRVNLPHFRNPDYVMNLFWGVARHQTWLIASDLVFFPSRSAASTLITSRPHDSPSHLFNAAVRSQPRRSFPIFNVARSIRQIRLSYARHVSASRVTRYALIMMWQSCLTLGLLTLFSSAASAERLLRSNSLDSCQKDSSFSASLFNVVYTPDNNTIFAQLSAMSTVNDYVIAEIVLDVYGYQAVHQNFDPCTLEDMKATICPLTVGKLPPRFNFRVGDSVSKQIPGIAYAFPDLDAKVRVHIRSTRTDETLACVEAKFSNDKTVDLVGVKWATAAVTLVGLIASALMSGVGYTNAAAHLGASTLSLFAYFQAQAMVGLSGVPLPPAAQAWTQNFVWSLGLIRIGFMQTIFTWYQRSTGGDAAGLLDNALGASVQVMKRSLDPAAGGLQKRSNVMLDTGAYVVYGIQRVGYKAHIETTNIVMTSIVFSAFLVLISALFVYLARLILNFCVKRGWVKDTRFPELRGGGWRMLLKGITLRMLLAVFPAIAIFCFWEFTQADSAAIVVLCVFLLFGSMLVLGVAAVRIITIGRNSKAVHRSAAYQLFSNQEYLQIWGFLYVPFRATAYYYILPLLVHTVVKAAIIAFGQHNGVAQAICLIIVEAVALAAASLLRPWMAKSINVLNIAICSVNFVNAIFLFLLTNKFDAPGLLVGVVGILIFLVNAIFSLILLLLVIISSIMAFWRKNPDDRYRAMDDDRVMFWKSRTSMVPSMAATQELEALAATARGAKDSQEGSHRIESPPLTPTIGARPGSRRVDSPALNERSSSVHDSVRDDQYAAPRAPWKRSNRDSGMTE
ncbi:hypothetical protein BN1723_002397 [Verticillium longisporum]|uniref:ML-like domain-containing protein n=1 Tax=Verticillium longisporum TaxID=100787 RepID=A0A0G4L5I5_VERLO|nr:hypothetical protein BN1723_002397 [Verticillium longisporum]